MKKHTIYWILIIHIYNIVVHKETKFIYKYYIVDCMQYG